MIISKDSHWTMEEEEEDDVRTGIRHNWIVNINLELEDPEGRSVSKTQKLASTHSVLWITLNSCCIAKLEPID